MAAPAAASGGGVGVGAGVGVGGVEGARFPSSYSSNVHPSSLCHRTVDRVQEEHMDEAGWGTGHKSRCGGVW